MTLTLTLTACAGDDGGTDDADSTGTDETSADTDTETTADGTEGTDDADADTTADDTGETTGEETGDTTDDTGDTGDTGSGSPCDPITHTALQPFTVDFEGDLEDWSYEGGTTGCQNAGVAFTGSWQNAGSAPQEFAFLQFSSPLMIGSSIEVGATVETTVSFDPPIQNSVGGSFDGTAMITLVSAEDPTFGPMVVCIHEISTLEGNGEFMGMSATINGNLGLTCGGA